MVNPIIHQDFSIFTGSSLVQIPDSAKEEVGQYGFIIPNESIADFRRRNQARPAKKLRHSDDRWVQVGSYLTIGPSDNFRTGTGPGKWRNNNSIQHDQPWQAASHIITAPGNGTRTAFPQPLNRSCISVAIPFWGFPASAGTRAANCQADAALASLISCR